MSGDADDKCLSSPRLFRARFVALGVMQGLIIGAEALVHVQGRLNQPPARSPVSSCEHPLEKSVAFCRDASSVRTRARHRVKELLDLLVRRSPSAPRVHTNSRRGPGHRCCTSPRKPPAHVEHRDAAMYREPFKLVAADDAPGCSRLRRDVVAGRFAPPIQPYDGTHFYWGLRNEPFREPKRHV